MGDGFALFDAKDRLVLHNRRFLELFPFLEQLGDLHGFTFFALASVPGGEQHRVAAAEDYVAERVRRHIEANGEPFEVPLENGGWAQVREWRTPDGGTVCSWRDISQLKAAQAKLLEAVDSIAECFVLLDPDDRLLLANSGMNQLFARADIPVTPGQSLSAMFAQAQAKGLFAEEVDPVFLANCLDQLKQSADERVEIPLRDGSWLLAGHRRMSNGCSVGIWTDVTTQKRRESELIAVREQLRQQSDALADFARLVALQARSDLLTGLPNRFALEERLDQLLRDGEPRNVWIGMIDIDHFKGVNDAVGHTAADELLRDVAHFLRAQLRGDDMLARFGGDEFAIVLTNIDEDRKSVV